MMKQWAGVSLLILQLAVCNYGSSHDNPCDDADSCDKCISLPHLCIWCPNSPRSSRCQMANTSCPGGVPEENPLPALVIIKDEPIGSQGEGVSMVQVSPQNISLSLRTGQPFPFNMTFRSLRNSPLDLYFLIDFSASQNLLVLTFRQDLLDIGEVLRSNVSSNYKMGFGSFVDKPILPFAFSDYRINDTSEIPEYIQGTIGEPFFHSSTFFQGGVVRCRAFHECPPTYSFRNSQPLTFSITEVLEAFVEAELSSNIDSPEGGFEALLQVAVCTNETGWRPGALHMVFLITDVVQHLAGDAKLAGIVTPNDGLCHLSVGESGTQEYTHALLQDYPSIFQIEQALRTNLVVPVIALRSNRVSRLRVERVLVPAYTNILSNTGAQVIVFNDIASSEIIRVIQESYEATVQHVRVTPPTVPGYTFHIDPIEGCDRRTEDGSCQLQFDEDVTFSVTVIMESCDEAADRRVQLMGFPFTYTTIDLHPLCQCPCSSEVVVNSAECSFRGNLQCGLCNCTTLTQTPMLQTATCDGEGNCSSVAPCSCRFEPSGDECEHLTFKTDCVDRESCFRDATTQNTDQATSDQATTQASDQETTQVTSDAEDASNSTTVVIVTIVVAVIVAMLFLLFVIIATGVCIAAYLKKPDYKPVHEPDIDNTYAEAGHVADSHFIMTPSAVYGQARKRPCRPREPLPDVMTGNAAYNLNVSAVNRIHAEPPDVMTKNSAYDVDEVHVTENAAYNVDVSSVNVATEYPDVITADSANTFVVVAEQNTAYNENEASARITSALADDTGIYEIVD